MKYFLIFMLCAPAWAYETLDTVCSTRCEERSETVGYIMGENGSCACLKEREEIPKDAYDAVYGNDEIREQFKPEYFFDADELEEKEQNNETE